MYIYRLQILSSKSCSEEQLNNIIGVSSNFLYANWGIEIIQSGENLKKIIHQERVEYMKKFYNK